MTDKQITEWIEREAEKYPTLIPEIEDAFRSGAASLYSLLKPLLDYWKKRCEAAEKSLIENGYDGDRSSESLREWHELKTNL